MSNFYSLSRHLVTLATVSNGFCWDGSMFSFEIPKFMYISQISSQLDWSWYAKAVAKAVFTSNVFLNWKFLVFLQNGIHMFHSYFKTKTECWCKRKDTWCPYPILQPQLLKGCRCHIWIQNFVLPLWVLFSRLQCCCLTIQFGSTFAYLQKWFSSYPLKMV